MLYYIIFPDPIINLSLANQNHKNIQIGYKLALASFIYDWRDHFPTNKTHDSYTNN